MSTINLLKEYKFYFEFVFQEKEMFLEGILESESYAHCVFSLENSFYASKMGEEGYITYIEVEEIVPRIFS